MYIKTLTQVLWTVKKSGDYDIHERNRQVELGVYGLANQTIPKLLKQDPIVAVEISRFTDQ